MHLGRRGSALVVGALLATGLVAAPAQADDPPVAGALTSGDSLYPDQGNGGYDVSHYDLAFVWNPGPPGGTIDATTTITATTTTANNAPLSSFGLDLEGLTVSSVTVNGTAATWSRLEEPDSINHPKKHKVVITPATPVTGTFTTVIHYDGNPTERGGETAGSDEGWIPTADGASFMNQPIGAMTGFPNNDTPKDKATYTITVDVPAGLEVVSNGEPQLPLPDVPNGSPGRSVWIWNETKQMASELATIDIGQFDVTQGTVSLSGGRTVPEYSFVDSAFSANSKAIYNGQRQQLSSILTSLEAFLGPYPGNSTGIVLDNTGVGYALETQDRPTFSTAGFIGDSLTHELTHQWYGDAVAPFDWNGIWVNEGMATWAPEHVLGVNETEFFGEWQGTAANSSRWTTPPSGMTQPQQLFGWQSYDRGAMTYEALRTVIGDTSFFALIKKWQADYNGQARKWTDLIAMAEQLSGRSLTPFFQDWIYDADKPAWPGRYAVSLGVDPVNGPVAAGGAMSYSLTATNTGRVPLTGAVATLDLTHVLDHATLGALPGGVTLAGSTLTWAVPTTSVGATETVVVPLTAKSDAAGATLSTTAAVPALATLGSSCTACTSSLLVAPATTSPPPAPLTMSASCTLTLQGRTKVGRTLRTGLAGCPAGATYTTQWFANGKPIHGATGPTLKLKHRQRGKRISVQASLTAPGYAPAVRLASSGHKVR